MTFECFSELKSCQSIMWEGELMGIIYGNAVNLFSHWCWQKKVSVNP